MGNRAHDRSVWLKFLYLPTADDGDDILLLLLAEIVGVTGVLSHRAHCPFPFVRALLCPSHDLQAVAALAFRLEDRA